MRVPDSAGDDVVSADRPAEGTALADTARLKSGLPDVAAAGREPVGVSAGAGAVPVASAEPLARDGGVGVAGAGCWPLGCVGSGGGAGGSGGQKRSRTSMILSHHSGACPLGSSRYHVRFACIFKFKQLEITL